MAPSGHSVLWSNLLYFVWPEYFRSGSASGPWCDITSFFWYSLSFILMWKVACQRLVNNIMPKVCFFSIKTVHCATALSAHNKNYR